MYEIGKNIKRGALMLQKKLVLPISALVLGVAFFPQQTFAADWSKSKSWSKSNYSAFPYEGNTSMKDTGDTVETHVRFTFDKKAIRELKSLGQYSQDDGVTYYTMDISVNDDNDETVSALDGGIYTDLPDPYMEVEDDPIGGNGYNDEAEVVCQDPDSLEAETDYRVEATWDVHDRGGTTFQFHSQLSTKDYSFEYNTIRYEFHVKQKFPW